MTVISMKLAQSASRDDNTGTRLAAVPVIALLQLSPAQARFPSLLEDTSLAVRIPTMIVVNFMLVEAQRMEIFLKVQNG